MRWRRIARLAGCRVRVNHDAAPMRNVLGLIFPQRVIVDQHRIVQCTAPRDLVKVPEHVHLMTAESHGAGRRHDRPRTPLCLELLKGVGTALEVVPRLPALTAVDPNHAVLSLVVLQPVPKMTM